MRGAKLFPNTLRRALRASLMIAILSNSIPGKPYAGFETVARQPQQQVNKADGKEKVENRAPQYRVEGKGPLLVYIAGLDGTGDLFFKQTPELARLYRVVTFRSRDDGRFTYDDLADDVAAIINNLGEQRATIVAESFGGGVALTFALRHPQMVERLVIVNSFPRFHGRLQIKIAILSNQVLPFWMTSRVRKIANTVALRADGVSREDSDRFFKAIGTVKREGYVRRLQLIEKLNVENRLSEIQAPTLFVAGEKDLLVPSVKEARRMAARMPNAKVRIIKGAGHACLLGNRVRLSELLAE